MNFQLKLWKLFPRALWRLFSLAITFIQVLNSKAKLNWLSETFTPEKRLYNMSVMDIVSNAGTIERKQVILALEQQGWEFSAIVRNIVMLRQLGYLKVSCVGNDTFFSINV